MTPYYEDDAVTLYHGDCREVLPSLDGIRCTVTSPPYNQLGGARVPKRGTHIMAGNAWLAKVNAHGYADTLPEAVYQAEQAAVASLIATASTSDASFFYNHKLRYRDGRVLHPVDLVRTFDPSWVLRQEIVWDRRCAIAFNARMFAPSDERVLWLTKPNAAHVWNQEAASWLSVWPLSPSTAADVQHPCPYPDTIPKRCILAASHAGDLVLDPFAGSGTTLRVAKDVGRRAVGVEADERYCEVAAKRLGQEVLDFGAAS